MPIFRENAALLSPNLFRSDSSFRLLIFMACIVKKIYGNVKIKIR
jgi:hypothetical protein